MMTLVTQNVALLKFFLPILNVIRQIKRTFILIRFIYNSTVVSCFFTGKYIFLTYQEYQNSKLVLNDKDSTYFNNLDHSPTQRSM